VLLVSSIQGSVAAPKQYTFLRVQLPSFSVDVTFIFSKLKKNFVTLVRKRTVPTERQPPCQRSVVQWSRVPGYRSRGPGFDSRRYQIFRERDPLSCVRITEELLYWKSSGSWSRKSRLTAVGIRCAHHAIPSIRKSWNFHTPIHPNIPDSSRLTAYCVIPTVKQRH
jgi:hypothetical protein